MRSGSWTPNRGGPKGKLVKVQLHPAFSNSSLLLISSGYAVLAAPYSIVASNNLDVAPEYSRCGTLVFLGFPSPETKL